MSFPTGTTEHPINQNRKQEILVSIWDFGAISSKTERSYYKFNDHPAKMRPSLARAILQIYGESPVLDPMCGIGTTCVEASLLGMESVGIEYEKKFVDQARKNIQHLQKIFPDKKLGRAKIIQGDARQLTQIFKQNAGSIIFSPPYERSLAKENPNRKKGYWKGSGGYQNGHGIGDYGKDPNNIGNIPQYGSIVFSPPFADSKHHYNHGLKKLGENFKGRKAWEEKKNIQTTPDNINNLRYGVFNSIVFSPSYSEGIGHVAGNNASEKYPWRLKLQRKMTESWSNGNIAKLKHGDDFFNSIFFSPPFGEANKGGGIAKNGYAGKHGIDEDLKNRIFRPVSNDRNNISNFLYGRSYLSEMFRVYSECYKVLKPGKFMVVVVKDIRRKGLCIPIAADTIKLCQLAGFELFDIIINRLYFASFWQVNLAIKDQEKGVMHPLKTHEYVLVFQKPKT